MTNEEHKTFTSEVPHHADVLNTRADVRLFLAKLFSTWDNTCSVTPITGGITNTIYAAHHATAHPSRVLVRIFGGKDVFTPEDRAKENLIFEQLGNCGIAPRLLAVFDNGRVESWLHARTIVLDEMTTDPVCAGVAKAMAKMHAFSPVGVAQVGTLWEVMDGWIGEVVKNEGAFGDVDVRRCVASLGVVKARLRKQESPIVFCHNDLVFGNIMMSEEGAVSVVDFEYSGYNYRGFDIGNFFCEAMGGTVDGYVDSAKYPSEAFRTRFCRIYLAEIGVEPTEERVVALVQEAEDYGLVSHMYWGFWALAQSAGSTVDFPYVMFAKNRFAEFFKRFTQK